MNDALGIKGFLKISTEMLRAHDHGYYQLTVPSGAFVIERVANIAQVSGRKARTPEWFREHVGQLALSELPEWRGWMVLVEHVFGQCYDDETADKMKYPSRHGVAHGRGSRLFGVVDSLNTILLAHIAVGAGVAFVLATRNDCIESAGLPMTLGREMAEFNESTHIEREGKCTHVNGY